MKVLITGASGFIGGHLLKAAIAAWGGDNVITFSSRSFVECHSIVYQGDGHGINDSDLVLIADVEVLIHAGAYTPKSGAEINAIGPCNSNISFTEKLLALPFTSLRKTIYLSTLDVYGPEERISESSAVAPSGLYGWSKLYCERMIAAFSKQRNISYQILRIGHVYGPGEEKYAKFLPKAIASIQKGAEVELYGDGSELRSFIYIGDVIKAILAAVELHEDVGVINVAGGRALSIRSILDQLMALSEKRVDVLIREAGGPKRDFVFDTRKLKQYLLAEEIEFAVGLASEIAHVKALN